MMKLTWFAFLIAVLVLGPSGCKQVYTPPVVNSNSGYLVVDGVLFNGNDSSIVKLSRTRSLADSSQPAPESGAAVSVVSSSGMEYPLTDIGNGSYGAAQLNLDGSLQYQLKIMSVDGNEYLSDLTDIRVTPPIDSVYWRQDSLGVAVYLTTHDPTNNARYYRWIVDETWQYHTAFVSLLDYVNGEVVFRDANNRVYDCYRTATLPEINVATSNKLSNDLIYQKQVIRVPTASEKLSFEYSAMIKQYTLTKDAFNYWNNLATNTQNTGSLFDRQPFTQQGNIHCVNKPGIPVIGYISFSTLQKHRIFISKNDVFSWNYYPYYAECEISSLPPPNDPSLLFPATGPPFFFTLIGTNNGTYLFTDIRCGDCRNHGGTTTKPSFWP